jgi:hypothetical protein
MARRTICATRHQNPVTKAYVIEAYVIEAYVIEACV